MVYRGKSWKIHLKMDDFGGTPIFGTPYIVVNQLYQYYKSWADIGWVERLAGTNHRNR
jgi:hypothetical protein